MNVRWLVLILLFPLVAVGDPNFPTPQIPYQPKRYLCTFTTASPVIDGQINDPCWQNAAWSDLFVDIEGDLKPKPYRQTRVKMVWDSAYFYVAAYLEEPHLWATYDQRDMVIYHENDFEVFIDPDYDTYNYYELELNALNTVWDLLLTKPYRDDGCAIDDWDIKGLKTAVHLYGTLNNPLDVDSCWTVEIAFPWKALAPCAKRPTPPRHGDAWKVNFSRVQYDLDVVHGKYQKRKDAKSGKPLPEYNWVWSPQGLIAMHYPEQWGWVIFSTTSQAPQQTDPPLTEESERQRERIWKEYYQKRLTE
ncbi:MAG: carbohydrate-binding family 9-like protein [bacterium]|nr:carbohydrate-binding family 9-like protein [bacterium]